MDAIPELILGDYVARLDGRVVEVLHRVGTSRRFHVTHLAVEGKERRNGELRLRVGIEERGIVINGIDLDVPPERREEAMAFFTEARRRRDAAAAR